MYIVLTVTVKGYYHYHSCHVNVYCLFTSCGSGLSGEALTDEGHLWVGLDISRPMLCETAAKDSNIV